MPPSWVHDYLGAAVLLVFEDLVAVWRLVERQMVADDDGGVDVAAAYPVEQRTHVTLHVALARLDGQRPVHDRPDGELVHQAAVHPDDGQGAAVAATQGRLPNRVRAFGF